MGYRVFRSNSLQEDYVEVSKKIIEDTVFSDVIPINTLTKNIYYSITALDFNYNNSAYAHPLKLSRPDNLPPVAPIFSDVFFDSTGVHIKWINSSSADVSKYTLERKAEDASSNTKLIKQWSAKDSVSAFIDTAVTEGTSYTYFISTTDSSGNSTQTKSGAVNFVRGLQKSVNAISAVVNRSKKTIEIQWKYDTKGVQKFILYKSIKGEPMRLFKTLPANTFLFTDNQLYINNIYLYAIKAIFTNGAESRMDYIVEVNY
ncbi:MAG: hypothetical protein IT235_06710 [Bacteroidia bacterium]|nr:hypothetical protein [Bacteroidia bacterium]